MGIQGLFDDAGEWLGEALETVGELASHPKFQAARGKAKELARAYALRNNRDDDEAFEELWSLTTRATIFSHAEHDRLVAEVNAQLAVLPRMADLAPMGTSFDRAPRVIQEEDAGGGAWRVHSGDTARRYVVFSDHHLLDDGHRQEFFGSKGNGEVYVDALQRFYGPADFTLVENGDVEELLILDPELHEVENIYRLTSRQVADYRREKSKPLLRRIVRSNRAYYDAVASLAAEGRYVKVAGNHDRAMVEEEFAGIVAEEIGKPFPVACDLLVLREEGAPAFLICHGHQFDSTCTPRFAMETGELFSQGAGWAYQGPDRFWLTNEDPIDDWLAGRRSLGNVLVTSEVEQTWLDDVVINGTSMQELIDAVGQGIQNLNTERGWENLYGKQIAWEYFDNAGDPQGCIDREVETGERWFKFRHLDEIHIADRLERAFGADVPTLVLGHSHEPRLRALRPDGREAGFYVNSGAAGRFQNLVWGVEIVGGVPSLVSWHHDDEGQAIRTLWEPNPSPIPMPGQVWSTLVARETTTVAEALAALEAAERPERRADVGPLIAIDMVLA